MRFLITGSSGHLGEALMRTLKSNGQDAIGLDVRPGAFTDRVGDICDADLLAELMTGVEAVIHAATLHKPHVATHSRRDFIRVNISGTETLLAAAREAGVTRFIFTSTTSTFGHAMRPEPGGPAVWVTEALQPVPKNIYGATKLAAEDLCWLAHDEFGMNVIILRTSRFFPEDDDNKATREAFSDDNTKTNEFLNRRADIEDMVNAHLKAVDRCHDIGFGTYIISATPPFKSEDAEALSQDAVSVISKYVDFAPIYRTLGWSMTPTLDRVYDNAKARRDLNWVPQHSFESVLKRMSSGGRCLSDLAYQIGKKGYHDQVFEGEGPYPVH